MALNHPRFSLNGTGKHPEPIRRRSKSAAAGRLRHSRPATTSSIDSGPNSKLG